MTKEEAKQLSIRKWEIIIEYFPEVADIPYPKEILELKHGCGYCEKYFGDDLADTVCIGCPIAPYKDGYRQTAMINCGCHDPLSIYNSWADSVEGSPKELEYAKGVLAMIKAS